MAGWGLGQGNVVGVKPKYRLTSISSWIWSYVRATRAHTTITLRKIVVGDHDANKVIVHFFAWEVVALWKGHFDRHELYNCTYWRGTKNEKAWMLLSMCVHCWEKTGRDAFTVYWSMCTNVTKSLKHWKQLCSLSKSKGWGCHVPKVWLISWSSQLLAISLRQQKTIYCTHSPTTNFSRL